KNARPRRRLRNQAAARLHAAVSGGVRRGGGGRRGVTRYVEGRLTMARKLTPTVGKVYGKQRDRYLELVCLFPLRPIRAEDELDAAIRVINMLIDQERLTKAEDDYL